MLLFSRVESSRLNNIERIGLIMKKNNFKRWFVIFIVAFGQAALFMPPYITRTFYDIYTSATGFTNQQVGNLMSIYGILAMIFYLIGGWLSDKFSIKKMLIFSFIGTALLTLYMSTLPSYPMMILVQVGFAVTTVLTFWGAMVKNIRILGEDNQSAAFSFNETMIGIMGMVVSFIALGCFNYMNQSIEGFKIMLYIYGAICCLVGIILIFVLKEAKSEDTEAIALSDIKKVLKIKQIWWCALLILSAYTFYSGLSYLNPYLTTAFGLSIALSSTLGIVRNYGIKLLAPGFGGILSSKLNSSTRAMGILFVASVICIALYLILPNTPSLIIVAVIVMLVVTFILTAIRAVYYVPIDESRIPMNLTGTAVGIICVIGYIPDAYFFSLVGGWIDKFGVTGYTYMFIYLIFFALLGILSCYKLTKMNRLTEGDVK